MIIIDEPNIAIFEDEIYTEDYMRWYNEEKYEIASIIATEPIRRW